MTRAEEASSVGMGQRALVGLTAFVHQLRPDWDEPGIAAALRKLDHLPPAAVAIAMIHAAGDPTNETPAAVTHFDNRAWEPRNMVACPKHPGNLSRRVNGECGSCYADRQAATDVAATFHRQPPTTEAAQARRQLVRH